MNKKDIIARLKNKMVKNIHKRIIPIIFTLFLFMSCHNVESQDIDMYIIFYPNDAEGKTYLIYNNEDKDINQRIYKKLQRAPRIKFLLREKNEIAEGGYNIYIVKNNEKFIYGVWDDTFVYDDYNDVDLILPLQDEIYKILAYDNIRKIKNEILNSDDYKEPNVP
ncbi:MAG: hypothetical protein MJ184_09005 [Treponema sp.]|uniref:hypothetical protein n=1 Tax=Treponema sp. TaxID=166 RepID=UPI00298D813B|nr:hypothetical protein [Treponema sp.]MCQ2601484.1 hypothetical protein [Treponema sp.]